MNEMWWPDFEWSGPECNEFSGLSRTFPDFPKCHLDTSVAWCRQTFFSVALWVGFKLPVVWERCWDLRSPSPMLRQTPIFLEFPSFLSGIELIVPRLRFSSEFEVQIRFRVPSCPLSIDPKTWRDSHGWKNENNTPAHKKISGLSGLWIRTFRTLGPEIEMSVRCITEVT